MKQNKRQRRCQWAIVFVCLGSAAWAADAQVSTAPAPRAASAAEAPKLQEAGELTITDRYGKKTLIDVYPTSARTAAGRAYTSGDKLDAELQVVAVRMGEHIASLKSGNLWKFPLSPDSAGSAQVDFDGIGVASSVAWKVKGVAGDRLLVEAEVVIPTNYGAIGPQHARLTGVWLATFDATFPIPIRSELKAKLNVVSQTANESTVVTWTPR